MIVAMCTPCGCGYDDGDGGGVAADAPLGGADYEM